MLTRKKKTRGRRSVWRRLPRRYPRPDEATSDTSCRCYLRGPDGVRRLTPSGTWGTEKSNRHPLRFKRTEAIVSPKKATRKRAAKRPRDPLTRLREICLALPEAHEVEAWGEPTFRVRNKLFAMHASADTHHGSGREGVWIASTRVTQDLVLRAKPDRYFSPPYVGPSGWIGAWLDRNPPWSEIAELLRDAYRLKAPKRLAATLGDD